MPRGKVLASLAILAVVLSASYVMAQATAPSGIAPAAVHRDTDTGTTPPAATPAVSPAAPGAAPIVEPSTTPAKAKGLLDQQWFLLVMIGAFVLFYLWINRGRKKEQKKRAEMLNEVKKGDKITTIGGIIGTVIDVHADEIVVKVDEASNAKIRFARWALRGVGDASKAENPDQKK